MDTSSTSYSVYSLGKLAASRGIPSALIALIATLSFTACNIGDPVSVRDKDGDTYPITSDCNDYDPTIGPRYVDGDGDGHGEKNSAWNAGCDAPDGTGYSSVADDCNDGDAAIYPDAVDICDALDNNCNGVMDEGDNTYYLDNDEDGFGDEEFSSSCDTSEEIVLGNYVESGGDCDDDNDAAYPDAEEFCDQIDNNCDETIDEGDNVFFSDRDGDGYGTDEICATSICTVPPEDCASENGDYNDADVIYYPGAYETCNGLDTNCDGQTSVQGDTDSKCDPVDNCDSMNNDDQANSDGDDAGDVCDLCPLNASVESDGIDTDSDLVGDVCDNCPEASNSNQTDTDHDGIGDACDPMTDQDGDYIADGGDNCITISNENQSDDDGDSIGDVCDNCPGTANPNQADTDSVESGGPDGVGDACDNCPDNANSNQMDRDQDTLGDVCDPCPDWANIDPINGSCDPEPENPDGTFFLYGSYPDNTYQAVPLVLDGNPYQKGTVYLSEQYLGSLDDFHITLVGPSGAEEISAPTQKDYYSDNAANTYAKWVYEFPMFLEKDSDYCLMINVAKPSGVDESNENEVDGRWPIQHTACFTTRVPCGVPVNAGYEADIVTLGKTEDFGIWFINAFLELTNGNANYPLAVLLEDIYTSTPFGDGFDVSVGLTSFSPANDNYNDPKSGYRSELGYSASFSNCRVSEYGDLTCEGDDVVFPLCSPSECITPTVSNAKITARVIASGKITNLEKFNLTGHITEDNFHYLINTSDISTEEGQTILSYIQYDLDTDGDGTLDAATFEVTTTSREVKLYNDTKMSDPVQCESSSVAPSIKSP